MSINFDSTNIKLLIRSTVRWEVIVSSKLDLGLGSTGVPDYPYFARNQWGNGNFDMDVSALPTTTGNGYMAELAEEGLGITDTVTFVRTGSGGSSHLECVSGMCQRVSGIGLDSCTTEGALCTGTHTRKELVTNLTSNESLVKAAAFFSDNPCVSSQYVGKRQEGENWVFTFDIFQFDPGCSYAEMGAGAGLAKFIAKNWSSIAALLASLGVVAIVWLWRDAVTAQPERDAKISDNDTASIDSILKDPDLTPAQKEALISEILKKSYGGTDWEKIILTVVIIISAVWLIAQLTKKKR